MQFTRRFAFFPLIFLASVCPSLLVSHPPAHALKTSDGSGSGTVDGDTIEAIVQFDAPAANGNSHCRWAPVRSATQGVKYGTDIVTTVGPDGIKRSLYARYCNDQMEGYNWIRDDAEPKAGISARQRVSKLLNMLVTKSAPPLDKQVVNVGTWFWVPRAAWKPLTVTAYIELAVVVITVSVTATPHFLRFSPGDGHSPVTCNGPGPVWNPHIGDTATSPCMYTYTSASHTTTNRTYKSKMAVIWDLSWTSNISRGGKLPSITTGIGTTSQVFELQALAQ